MRRGLGEMARAVDGVEEALRLRPRFVFNASSDGRDDAGVGECARDEAMDGRGEESVDMVALALLREMGMGCARPGQHR